MDTSSSVPSPYLTFMVSRVIPLAPRLLAGSIILTNSCLNWYRPSCTEPE